VNVRASSPSRRDAVAGAEPERLSLFRAMVDLSRLVARSKAPGLRWRLTLALVLTFGSKITDVLAPLFLGVAVNHLAGSHAVRAGRGAASAAFQSSALGPAVGWSFAGLAVGWAAMRFGSSIAPQVRDIVFGPVGQAAQRRAAAETFAHALSLSLDFHQTKRTGALARTVDRGARAVDFLLRILVFNLAPTALALVFAAGVLGKAYDWRFGATAVATVVIYGALTFAISDWRIGHRRVLNEADATASARAVDALLNYETVKAFGAESRAAANYDEALGVYAEASEKANTSLALLNIIQAAVMSAGLLVMALLAGLEVAQGRMGPGDITASILILTSLYAPLNILGFAYREIRQSTIDMEAMLALRKQEPGIADAPGAIDLPPCLRGEGGALSFEQVSFRHGSRAEGLMDVSFSARPGTTVAVVGPSGAGKSTLVKLALRLIDPQAGAVKVDGHDVRALTQASLRRAVALVPQDVALFNDTLEANIAFGRPGASDADVWAAAEAAELGAFIRGLPDGMETKVGERGLKLSGGERQRVGLARALIADPRILILDEATSALDSRTEAAIQATLRRAKAGRTTLVVAHRLSTIADADEILVLKNGRIVERGSHAQLVTLGGEYATLWKKQTRES
jgi:ABC-type transport system involved in Fe-S cluster assembly fused permease/ATPase subunit